MREYPTPVIACATCGEECDGLDGLFDHFKACPEDSEGGEGSA